MENLEKLLERIKNIKGTGSSIGPIINKIKGNNEYIREIYSKTSFLDSEYEDVNISQRIYHLIFDINKVERCDCGKPKIFSKYNRFSLDNKKHSNYYNYCGSIECLIEDFKKCRFGKQGYGALIHKITSDKNYKEQLLEKTEFLNSHYEDISDSQRFYHIFFKQLSLELCPYCGQKKKFTFNSKFSEIRYDKLDANYYGTCGEKKCMNSYGILRTKKGMVNKYGFDNAWKIPGYREKLENTNLKRYGSKYITGSNIFREKCQETYNRDWDGEHPTKKEKVQNRKRETNLEKYGFTNALQNSEIYQRHIKSCYKSKEYKLPSGKIIKLQGYEPWAMDILLEKYNEGDLITDKGKINDILGNFKFIINSKESIYFPDIYIKSENTIIEVKSEYTYNCSLEENTLKKDSVISKGILFQFWIFTPKKELVIIT